MPIDLVMFADKFRRYCDQLGVTCPEISSKTGIPLDRLTALAEGTSEPTGDEVLILADFFRCDFKFFISNEKLAPFEQTESLFRMHGAKLTPGDRWVIQEFLFLCECQEFLLRNLSVAARHPFTFRKRGNFYKEHGRDAAFALRGHLGYQSKEVAKDIYRDFREIGIHVFRRVLGQSAISGLFVRHPTAGPCVLVNYSEDVFRQRFTVAHEAAHAILDDDTDFVVSFSKKWSKKDLSELRAYAFASHLLMPPEFLKAIPDPTVWDEAKLVDWAERLMVNPDPLLYALKDAGLISNQMVESLKGKKIPSNRKSDAELPGTLPPLPRVRKEQLLQRGLSGFYVGLCFDGYEHGVISAGRLAEMLLVTEPEVAEIAQLYGRTLAHVD